MSLRAELIRFCLPWFMRPRFPSDIQIEDVRRRMARLAQLVPPPPRGTELIVVDAGGVKAERIATPPTLIHVGSDEALRDDAVRMAQRLRAGGREIELEVWPRMFHVWHMFARILPEARAAIARVGAFLRARL